MAERYCSYRSCFVPKCKNTSRNSNKKFICVPKAKSRRIRWFEAVGRQVKYSKTVYYCCEDHFNLEEDMENYICHKLMNGGKIRMKPNVVPHIFRNPRGRPKRTNREETQLPLVNANCITTPEEDDTNSLNLLTVRQENDENLLNSTPKHNESNLLNPVITLKENDPNLYLVVNSESEVQGVLIFMNYLIALTSQNASIKSRSTDEQAVPPAVENPTCRNVENDEKNEEVHDTVAKKENGGVAMEIIKEERAETEEKGTDLGEKECTNISVVKIKEEIAETDEKGIDLGEKECTNTSVVKIKEEIAETDEKGIDLGEQECTNTGVKIKEENDLENCIAEHYDENDFKQTDLGTEFAKYKEENGNLTEDEDRELQMKSETENDFKKETFVGTELVDADEKIVDFEEEEIQIKSEVESCDDYSIDGADVLNDVQDVQHGLSAGNDSLKEDLETCGVQDEKTVEASEENGEQHVCAICNFRFFNAASLTRHNRLHPEVEALRREERPMTCDFCNQQFAHSFLLRCHEATVHRKKAPYLCHKCGKTYTFKSQYESHVRVHTDVRPFPCRFCDKTFRQRNGRKYHEASHTEEGQTLLRLNAVVGYANSSSGAADAQHICSVCNIQFSDASGLRQHKRLHHLQQEKPQLVCKFCNKNFSQRHALKTHEMTHAKVRPFSCPICEKTFAVKSNLAAHARVHTNDRPFVCQFCGKAFKYRYPHKRHEASHTEERPFSCRQCSRSFYKRHQLRRHLCIRGIECAQKSLHDRKSAEKSVLGSESAEKSVVVSENA